MGYVTRCDIFVPTHEGDRRTTPRSEYFYARLHDDIDGGSDRQHLHLLNFSSTGISHISGTGVDPVVGAGSNIVTKQVDWRGKEAEDIFSFSAGGWLPRYAAQSGFEGFLRWNGNVIYTTERSVIGAALFNERLITVEMDELKNTYVYSHGYEKPVLSEAGIDRLPIVVADGVQVGYLEWGILGGLQPTAGLVFNFSEDGSRAVRAIHTYYGRSLPTAPYATSTVTECVVHKQTIVLTAEDGVIGANFIVAVDDGEGGFGESYSFVPTSTSTDYDLTLVGSTAPLLTCEDMLANTQHNLEQIYSNPVCTLVSCESVPSSAIITPDGRLPVVTAPLCLHESVVPMTGIPTHPNVLTAYNIPHHLWYRRCDGLWYSHRYSYLPKYYHTTVDPYMLIAHIDCGEHGTFTPYSTAPCRGSLTGTSTWDIVETTCSGTSAGSKGTWFDYKANTPRTEVTMYAIATGASCMEYRIQGHRLGCDGDFIPRGGHETRTTTYSGGPQTVSITIADDHATYSGFPQLSYYNHSGAYASAYDIDVYNILSGDDDGGFVAITDHRSNSLARFTLAALDLRFIAAVFSEHIQVETADAFSATRVDSLCFGVGEGAVTTHIVPNYSSAATEAYSGAGGGVYSRDYQYRLGELVVNGKGEALLHYDTPILSLYPGDYLPNTPPAKTQAFVFSKGEFRHIPQYIDNAVGTSGVVTCATLVRY
jgi:hypothetical protein